MPGAGFLGVADADLHLRAAMTATDAPRCYALVPCAGIGARSGAGVPKQYATIAGRAMVAHTLALLYRCIDNDDERKKQIFSWICRLDPSQAMRVN